MWQDRRKRFAATCIKSSDLPVRNFVNRPQMVYQISHSFHLFATDVTGLWDLSVYAVFFFEMSVGIFLRCESCPTDQTRARPIRHYCYHIWNIQQGDKKCQKVMYFVSKCLSNSKLFYTSLYPCGDFGASPKKFLSNSYSTHLEFQNVITRQILVWIKCHSARNLPSFSRDWKGQNPNHSAPTLS